MLSIFQNFKDKFIYDYHECLITKSWMVLLGYFHMFVILSFKEHFKMLAAYRSTYLWHDLKTRQDLKAVGEGGAECHELRNDRASGKAGGLESFLFCGFLLFWVFVCEISSLPN